MRRAAGHVGRLAVYACFLLLGIAVGLDVSFWISDRWLDDDAGMLGLVPIGIGALGADRLARGVYEMMTGRSFEVFSTRRFPNG